MDQTTSESTSPRTLAFEFMGSGKEYFKIWIVNLILSILTLGIYSAWAKVRTNRYFYGNTQLAGSGFEYHAKPLAILKGRLIAVAILLVYVLVGNMFPYAGIAFAVVAAIGWVWVAQNWITVLSERPLNGWVLSAAFGTGLAVLCLWLGVSELRNKPKAAESSPAE